MTLLNWIKKAKETGTTIVFDPKYRDRLWKDFHEAQETLGPFIDVVDLLLTSDDDLKSLLPDQADTVFVLELMEKGCSEAVIRRGPEPCDIFHDGKHLKVDAVNAARQAHSVAAQVVAHKGAVIPV
jgi:2-dehydro-3-deoxygluconokinase